MRLRRAIARWRRLMHGFRLRTRWRLIGVARLAYSFTSIPRKFPMLDHDQGFAPRLARGLVLPSLLPQLAMDQNGRALGEESRDSFRSLFQARQSRKVTSSFFTPASSNHTSLTAKPRSSTGVPLGRYVTSNVRVMFPLRTTMFMQIQSTFPDKPSFLYALYPR